MNTKPFNLEIRNDDVLQSSNFSRRQREAWQFGSPFEWFKSTDEMFEKYGYLCTLVILSEGIQVYPEWVDYIKKNQYRYKIELHGSSHFKYGRMSRERGLKDLKEAKELIENTFGTQITTWYIPYGRKNIPDWAEEVCEELGMKADIPKFKSLPQFWNKPPEKKQINFHYWDKKQIKQVRSILSTICKR